MFATLLTVALFIAPAIRGVLGDFVINTVNLTQCQDAHITWSQGQAPYNLIVVPAADPCGDTLADLGDHNGTSMTYKVAIPAGQTVALSLEDENGDEAWSGDIVIQPSSDASCLPSNTTGSSVPSARTTLSVAYTGPAVASPSASSGGAVPVGAAGSGPLHSGSSLNIRQLSVPALGVTVLAGVLAFAL